MLAKGTVLTNRDQEVPVRPAERGLEVLPGRAAPLESGRGPALAEPRQAPAEVRAIPEKGAPREPAPETGLVKAVVPADQAVQVVGAAPARPAGQATGLERPMEVAPMGPEAEGPSIERSWTPAGGPKVSRLRRPDPGVAARSHLLGTATRDRARRDRRPR